MVTLFFSSSLLLSVVYLCLCHDVHRGYRACLCCWACIAPDMYLIPPFPPPFLTESLSAPDVKMFLWSKAPVIWCKNKHQGSVQSALLHTNYLQYKLFLIYFPIIITSFFCFPYIQVQIKNSKYFICTDSYNKITP